MNHPLDNFYCATCGRAETRQESLARKIHTGFSGCCNDNLMATKRPMRKSQLYTGAVKGEPITTKTRAKDGKYRPAEHPKSTGSGRGIKPGDAIQQVKMLIAYFNGKGYSRFGFNGDECGISPAQTAIAAMRDFDVLLKTEAGSQALTAMLHQRLIDKGLVPKEPPCCGGDDCSKCPR